MNQEKQKKFLLSIAYYGGIALGAYLVLRFLIPPLVPFLIGFCIAWILRRPTSYLNKKLHITHKIPAAILTAIFYILILCILFFAGTQLFSALKNLLPKLPDMFTNQLLPFINRCIDKIKEFARPFDASAAAQIDTWFNEIASSMSQMITALSSSAVKLISSIAAGTPDMILKIVLTVVTTFYFALDFERITSFLGRILPPGIKKKILPLKEKAQSSLKIFLRSYFLIFLLTFAELSIGFLILHVPYAVLIALLVAIIDLMPVLGTGLILLPWAVISAVIGKIPFAIGMVLLYLLITIIRNIVEPKLVGKQMGLHPLATLISMFVGLQLFGILGMFLLPVLLSLLLQFKRDGILKLPSWMEEKTSS
ncbi:MAG: sporulation integral membrane protein YtvI [Eubacteriales bacterium]